MISIPFQAETQFGIYRDVLILPDNHTKSDQEIEDLKQRKIDSWIQYLSNPPFVAGPDPESLLISTEEETPSTESGV